MISHQSGDAHQLHHREPGPHDVAECVYQDGSGLLGLAGLDQSDGLVDCGAITSSAQFCRAGMACWRPETYHSA